MRPVPLICSVLLALLAALLAGGAAAQPATVAPITATPLIPGESIVLDGTLAHPAWQRAPVHDAFVEKFPVVGAAPSQATRVQVLFDARALYIGITALDNDPARIRRAVVRADAVNRTQDFVVAYVDAIGRRSSAQFFRVNAAGSTADGLHTAADDSEDFAPDFDWDAAVAQRADGWTTVLRLPFASLRYAPGSQQAWRIMVARRLPREQFHLFTSVAVPREAASFIATMQPLDGVRLPPDSQFVSVRPSVTLRAARDEDGRRSNNVDASLDVKWRPHASLLIDATLNPDFSQVELDVPQLAGNTRFALALTEKRPFFFESADLLRSPTEAFYTRSFTEPRGGLRATWRGAAWGGSAFAISDRGGGLVLLPGTYGTGAAEQPASSTLAARARNDDGRLAWGGLAVSRRYADGRGSNDVIGPDFGWQLGNEWRLRGQWLHARSTARDLDGDGRLERAPAQQGSRVYLRALRNADNGESMLGIDDTGSGFRHDSGFVNQAGTRRVDAFHSHVWHGAAPFNEVAVNVEALDIRNRDGGEQVQQVVRPGLYASGAHNFEGWLNFYLHSTLRTAAGAPLLHERYVELGTVVTPAPWFPLLEAEAQAGRLADTVATDVRPGGRVSVKARLRPLAALELEPSVNLAWLRDDGQRVYRESALQWLAVWHFDARHSLRAIVQRSSLERRPEGDVPAHGEHGSAGSLTYAWRRSSGTRLYVGATRARQYADGANAGRAALEAFVKLQLDVGDVVDVWRSAWQ